MTEILEIIATTGPEAMWSVMLSTLGLGIGVIGIITAAFATKPRWGIGIGTLALLLGVGGLVIGLVAYSNGLEIAERFVEHAPPDMKEELLRVGRADVRKLLWVTAGAAGLAGLTGAVALFVGLRRRDG